MVEGLTIKEAQRASLILSATGSKFEMGAAANKN